MLQWIYDGMILVPKNENGIRDCEFGFISNDVEVFPISPDEYDQLEKTGIISALNELDGVMFDQYEGDYIPLELLSKCISIFSQFNVYEDCLFLQALKTGLKNGFGVYTLF